MKNTKMVICNKRNICKMKNDCGDAVPHEPCSECGNGSMCKKLNAKCIEIPPHLQKEPCEYKKFVDQMFKTKSSIVFANTIPNGSCGTNHEDKKPDQPTPILHCYLCFHGGDCLLTQNSDACKHTYVQLQQA